MPEMTAMVQTTGMPEATTSPWFSHRLVLVVIALALMSVLVVLNLLRKRKLREEYALWWFLVVAIAGAFGLFPRVGWWITNAIGASYPFSTLIIFSFVFILFTLIYFSMKVSILSDQVRDLTQNAAFLRRELEELRGRK